MSDDNSYSSSSEELDTELVDLLLLMRSVQSEQESRKMENHKLTKPQTFHETRLFCVELKAVDCHDQVEPKILATLPLPSDLQLQLRGFVSLEDLHCSYRSRGQKFAFSLLLTGSGDFPLEISATLDKTFGRPNEAVWYNDEVKKSWVKLTVGETFPLVGLRCDESDSRRHPPNSIRLELSVRWEIPVGDRDKWIPPEKHADIVGHLQLFESLLAGHFSDCQILTAEDDYIKSHKVLLSLKSDVISKAFEREETAESKANLIRIDFATEIVRLILPHFYTGQMPEISSESAMEAFKLADMYQIGSLRVHLAGEIQRRADQFVGVENVLQFASFADTFSLADLFSFCLKFVKSHRSEVIKLAGWEDFRQKFGEQLMWQ